MSHTPGVLVTLASPGTEVICGALLLVASTLVLRRVRASNDQSSSHTPTATSRVAASAALLALVGWILGSASDMLLAELPAATWWRYAAPIVGAAVGTAILLIAVARTPTHVEACVAPTARRTWVSFANPRELRGAIATGVTLIVVSVLAGLASSAADGGWYSRLTLDGGGSASFFGWTYGLPVVAATAVLAGLGWTTLSLTSRRPYSHPDAVALETAQRRATTTAVLRLSFGALLLSLGGALHFIGDAGLGSAGLDYPGVGTFVWSAGYFSFAPTILWVGWGMQVTAVAILIRIVLNGLRRRQSSTTHAAGSQTAAGRS